MSSPRRQRLATFEIPRGEEGELTTALAPNGNTNANRGSEAAAARGRQP